MNNTYKLWLILIYLFCNQSGLYSQTFPYYHYNSNEGLASSQVYEMIQDRNGFMWFATPNGVSRFDGHKFKNFTTNDGLSSNSISSLIEDTNSNIFSINEENNINIYDENKFLKYSHQTESNPPILGMFTDAGKLYTYSLYLISAVDSEKAITVFRFPQTDTLGIHKILNNSNGSTIVATSRGLYKFENQKLIKMDVDGLEDQEIFWLCSGNDNNIFLGAVGKIYEVKNNTVVRSVKVDLFEINNVKNLFCDSKGNIWFSIMFKGFYCIESGTEEIKNIGIKMGLEKKFINNFLEDNEGNIWISSYGDGVFCLYNLYLKNYTQQGGLSNNMVTALAMDNYDRMFIGTLDGLNIMENDSLNLFKSEIKSNTDYLYVYDIKCYNDSVYVGGTYNNSFKVSETKFKNDRLFLLNSPVFCITGNNQFTSGGWFNFIHTMNYPPKTTDGDRTYLVGDSSYMNRINSIYEDNRNNLWIGTTFGVCKIENGQKTFFQENEILNADISHITQDRKNNIWFAGTNGITCFNSKDSIFTNYSEINEQELSSSNSLAVDKYNRLWIGTMNGLFIYDINGNEGKHSLKAFNTTTGLITNEITTLYYDSLKNKILAGTSAGFSSIDINEFDNSKILPVELKIVNVKAKDSMYAYSDNFIFEPGTENVHINFTSINFSSPSTVTYQYKLGEDWINISEDNINFPSLEKGDYKLEVRGKAINTSWGEPKLVSFTVLPSFSETFYFRTTVAGLIIFGIVFGASKRIKYIKAREKEKFETNNQVNDLKHKALSSMMNPHFIFNSLNSVQHLVNSDRKREANDYISLMAKLIRMNLETASESYIRLDDEIKRLDLYLQIEKLRFSERFEYKIITGGDIDPETILIPNMIIQPFVENSIWHGIMPSGRDGFLKLSFKFEDVKVDDKSYKFFIIRITDNGIGLTESQKNKKDGHISRGIQIIQERLILLSRESKLPRPIFEDLNSKNKDTHGTEVVLSIPPELYRIK